MSKGDKRPSKTIVFPVEPKHTIAWLSVKNPDGQLVTDGNVILTHDHYEGDQFTGAVTEVPDGSGLKRYTFSLPADAPPHGYDLKLYHFEGLKDANVRGDKPFSVSLDDVYLQEKMRLPEIKPLEELVKIRCAIWTVQGPWPYGPRPYQPDNITAMEYIHTYGGDPANLNDTQKAMIQTYKNAGYRNVAYGPILDPGGYHGLWPATNFTTPDGFRLWLDWLQMYWDNGLIPICFLHVDGATFEETVALYEPLILANLERCQHLMQIVVPAGWEPAKYEWSSNTWAAYGEWIGRLLPNSLVCLHTVADVDAPVGTDSRGDDNGKDNAIGWQRVAQHYHVWLHQGRAFENPNIKGMDTRYPERTNFDNWVNLFNPSDRTSLVGRFNTGYAGWPTHSKWGYKPLQVIPFEWCSYWVCWNGRSVIEGNNWGDRVWQENRVIGLGDGCSPYLGL